MQILIDGKRLEAKKGESVLTVAKRNGIGIPSLCFHEALEPTGACRLCTVEITHKDWGGWKGLVASCLYPVQDGLEVSTMSEAVVELRRTVLDLLLARSPDAPQIRALAAEYGLSETTYPIVTPGNNCILCYRCVRVCEAQGFNALTMVHRGISKEVGTAFNEPPEDCVGCLSCVHVCPTGVITYEQDADTRTIWGMKFDLVKCSECGRPLTTSRHIEASMKKSGLDENYYKTCDACRKKAVAVDFAQVGR